jgi:hypothetical protein
MEGWGWFGFFCLLGALVVGLGFWPFLVLLVVY